MCIHGVKNTPFRSGPFKHLEFSPHKLCAVRNKQLDSDILLTMLCTIRQKIPDLLIQLYSWKCRSLIEVFLEYNINRLIIEVELKT
jgi:hypothetical protein